MDEETGTAALAAERCVACRPGAPRLGEEELAALLPLIPGWAVIERNGAPRLRREFRFPDFAGALAFTVRVGEAAEADGHHPALLTEWGKVTVSWWTHAIGGLHRNDVVMAAKTDALSAGSRQ
ncbi:MAG: 4a-hydroxytetrahydrobiopterin dehydratase [Chloroflexota bacterium]|nr:4a-hydroxytetrahydrobiopterin dehydratase [Chloroflexota bacterium]